jgi:PAS domain S-box-containing protein
VEGAGPVAAETIPPQVTEFIPQQVWTATADGALDYVNTRVTSFFGATMEQVIGWGWKELVHPEDLPEAIELWVRSLKTGEPDEVEFRLWCAPKQEYRCHLAQALPMRAEDGTILKWFGTNTDISQRKQAEVERDEALAEARRANEAKNEFLAVLSHELRTPLNPVLLAVSALETDPHLPAPVRADITMIRRNVELEARLIDDLLDFTRIANGKLQLRLEAVEANALVERALDVVRGDPSLTMPRVILDPDAAKDRLHADSSRLLQIIWNLVKNAAKFTPAEGVIRIRSSNPDAATWRLEVSDTGRGISPEALPLIFGAFEQGPRDPALSLGGLGLGLAISRAITEFHAGRLSAKSEGAGRGALFTLDLPLDLSGATVPAPSSAAPLDRAGALRILIVEDHETSGLIVERLLRRKGHACRLARSAGQALLLASEASFDLVVSDIGLPDRSGFELMRELQARHGLSGIAMSGYGMETDVTEGRQAGFLVHLTKPLDIQQLHAAIADFSRMQESRSSPGTQEAGTREPMVAGGS